jgi:polysaccharide export outer membrane protein
MDPKSQRGKQLFRRMLSFIAFLILFAGCTNTSMTKNEMVETRIADQNRTSKTDKMNEKIFSKVQPTTVSTDPLLGSGDLLELKVFEASELDSQVRVSSRGFITLPLLADVEVAGLTARQVEMKVEGLYRAKYIKDPHVSLFVREHLSQRVTFVGQVKKPGTYELPDRIKLLDALALAGGLTQKSGGTAQVRRVGKTKEDTGSYIVDLDRLIEDGAVELNIPIQGGDIIFIPEGGMFYVDGAVRMTGAFPVKATLTLEEAIMTAGGFLSYADAEDVILVRRNSDNKREVKHLNLEVAKHGLYPIKDGDILVVGSTFWGRLSSGSGFSLGIPFVGGVSYSNPQRYR